LNTVVYYPHQTPSPKWLKLSALCWDKVYCLKPRSYKDHREIWELDRALGGILASIDIADIAADEQVQASFKTWAIAKAEELKTEKKLYWQDNLYKEDLKLEWTQEQLGVDTSLSEIYKQVPQVYEKKEEEDWVSMSRSKFGGNDLKVRFDFVSFLKEVGLATSERHQVYIQVPQWKAKDVTDPHYYMDNPGLRVTKPEPGSAHEKYEMLENQERQALLKGDSYQAEKFHREAKKIWQDNLVTVTPAKQPYSSIVYMPKDVALHYLSLCASKASMDGKRDLATESEKFTGVVLNDVPALRSNIITTILEAYLPENFNSLAAERIAEIRSEFATQRLKYESAVQSLCNEFADIASEGELGKLNDRIIEIAKERIEDTKNTYKRANLQLALQSLGISLTPPALVGSIASVLGIGIFAPAGIAAALSAFAAKTFLDWHQAKDERNKSPWSYILNVAKKSS
jgi:hypothetical protein